MPKLPVEFGAARKAGIGFAPQAGRHAFHRRRFPPPRRGHENKEAQQQEEFRRSEAQHRRRMAAELGQFSASQALF